MSSHDIPNNEVSYNKLLSDFKNLLKENNLKYTKQREIILESLYNNEDHLTAKSTS